MRVIFDCPAESGRELINKNFITAPDHINKLIRIIMEFQEEHVAIMVHIQGMFYQAQVVEEHRRFLLFLWWKDIDTNKNVMVHGLWPIFFSQTGGY